MGSSTFSIALVLAAMISGGHVLLEDVPGTAKTILARAIAQSVDGATFARIQCTPDLQPTDITGLAIFDQRTQLDQSLGVVDRGGRIMDRTRSHETEQTRVGTAQDTADGLARLDHSLGDRLIDAQFFLEHARSNELLGGDYMYVLNLSRRHSPMILAEKSGGTNYGNPESLPQGRCDE